MDIAALANGKYILWGANWSLYSATVRPYLIKRAIDYIELNPSHPHFGEYVLPQIGHFTVPVLEKPNGDIIADSSMIIEYLESEHSEGSLLPDDRILRALAHLIHSYGTEGLHKPAMYYRWNNSFENREFIIGEFNRSNASKAEREAGNLEVGKGFAAAMRAGFLPVLGIRHSNDVDSAIEQSTAKLYQILNEHFLEYPYILGGRPSIADCGLMGPLYAHLGRDISTNSKLKTQAPALYRWIETMGRAAIVDPETWHVPPEYFGSRELPESLLALLHLICDDYGPEIIATAELYHGWLNNGEARPSGSIVSHDGQKANHQILGEIQHEQQGVTISRAALLDCIVQHQRMSDVMDKMDEDEREMFGGIMQMSGGQDLINLRLERPLKRQDYAMVLA